MKVCAYIQSTYAKQAYTHESYNQRAWPGFEMVLDACRRSGWAITFAGIDTVHRFDAVLVSITSDCDWWAFLAERLRWRKGKYRVIAGGAGVLNVRPFLRWVDVFVFGRAEHLIVPVLSAMGRGDCLDDASVCYSETFDVDRQYRISQSIRPYSHELTLANGKKWREGQIGCPHKCAFCGYTWHRKHSGGEYNVGSDIFGGPTRQYSMIDLLKRKPWLWGSLRTVGLDGMSERLRRMVRKNITREMWRDFLQKLPSTGKPHQVKVYTIVGYPTETDNDWREVVEDIRAVDETMKAAAKQWSLLFCITPFRPMPATPSACWPMVYQDYRGRVAATLKKDGMPGKVFHQGQQYWCVEGLGTDSLATVSLSAICLRGVESDSDNVAAVAQSKRFWSANMAGKIGCLEKRFDVDRLFGSYNKETLPTRYLKGYTKRSTFYPITDGCTNKISPSVVGYSKVAND